MRNPKYYIALDEYERRLIINSLNNLRHKLIAEGRSINSEKVNITFSALPILKNIANNNAARAMSIGTRNFINTLFLEIK